MKDKLKGLAAGLLIGTLFTGTAAFATNSTSIEVFFRPLHYIFDGEAKAPSDGAGFIYNGSTYVPLRFVSEALGKEVNFDNDTGTIWIGKHYGGENAAVVASYKGGQVTKIELDSFIAASVFLRGGQPSGDPKYREVMLKQLIAMKLYAAKAPESAQAEAAAHAEQQLGQIQFQVGSAAGLKAQLEGLNANEHDLKSFMTLNVMAMKGIEQSITDEALQGEYDRLRAADPAAFVVASVRHILIATSDAATGMPLRTEEEALKRAKDVQDKLAKGGDFAALAAEYSDDPGSKANGGMYENATISTFVEPFKKASLELSLGKTSDPVQTAYGYHLIEVTKRGVTPLSEAASQLKPNLINKTFQDYMMNEVPGLIESINLQAGVTK